MPGNRKLQIVVAMAVAAWLASLSAGIAQTRQGGRMIADFESRLPAGIKPSNATIARVSSSAEAAVGRGYLRMRMRPGAQKMLFRMPLPGKLDMAQFRALNFRIRATPAGKQLPLRWYALDDAGDPLFQRRLTLGTFEKWVKIEEPLPLWRWAGDNVGRWTKVRGLALVVEKPVGELWLDDLRLADGPRENAAYPTDDWLLRLAFPDGKTRVLAEDGFLIATDAVEQLSETDLRTMLVRMQRIRRWVRRIFGKAAGPAEKRPAISLLIFRQPDDYRAFYQRLGTAWRAEIVAPAMGGYTVQDFTGSPYLPKFGIDRPVYLHETVHAVVAREVHIRSAVAEHSWLQEGLANYLQLCVYPESLSWQTYTRNFARPIAADGSTFFKPLKSLTSRRAGAKSYAQLASVVAFLIEERPDWLPQIASGLAAGRPIATVLSRCGTDFEKLQAEWLAWGRRQFVSDAAAPPQPPRRFPLPKEWPQPPQPQDKPGQRKPS